MQYPGGSSGELEEQVTTVYNEQGLAETLKNLPSVSYVDGAKWDAMGRPELWTFGGSGLNLQVKWEYYSDDQRLQRLRGGTSVTLGRDLDLQYVYDNVGNVTQLSDKRGGVTQIQTFTYDALDRLTQGATSGAGTWGTYSESYTYNTIGNLTSKGGATYNYPPSGVGSVRPHAVTGTTGLNAGGSFEYDANGNMTSRLLQTGGTAYSQVWDAENRLVSVTAGGQTTSFAHDGDGALVKKVAGGETTVYVGNYYEKQGTAVTKYYYSAGQRVAMRTGSGLSYLAGDHLGTTSVTWNISGVKVAEARHLPYGGERWTSGTMPTDYRFTGQRLTASLGLYQMGARWYDGSLGRWLSADTIVPEPKNPQSLNRYSYVRNRPLNLVDPSGHAECVDEDCNWVLHPVSGEIIQRRPTTSPPVQSQAYDPATSYAEAAGLAEEFRGDAGPLKRDFDPTSSLTQDIMASSGMRKFHSAWAAAGNRVPFEWHHHIDVREGPPYPVRSIMSLPAYIGAQARLALTAVGIRSQNPQGPIDAVGGTIGSLDTIRARRVGAQWVKIQVENTMNWSSGLRIPGGNASLAVVPIPLTGKTVGDAVAGTIGGMYETRQTFVWWERMPDWP